MPRFNLGSLQMRSAVIDHGGAIPTECTCDGPDVSPALEWDGVPEGTVELVLIMHDPDAPLIDGFTHWAVHGISPDSTGCPAGGLPPGAVVDQNELGEAAWMGPAPPPGHGQHHYFFHLYAVDRPITGEAPLTRQQLLDQLDDRVLAQARLVGTYER